MLQVKDGSRTLQFEGELLARSSSQRRDSDRWVEFELYRVESGSYVMARIGFSLLYHLPGCEVVARNKLRDAPRSQLADNAIPCSICQPEIADPNFPMVCPELPRYRAWVCEGPVAVLDSLYRYDPAGSRYLTLVSERLLDEAADRDSKIADAYRVETIS